MNFIYRLYLNCNNHNFIDENIFLMKKLILYLLTVSAVNASGKENVRLHGKITNPLADSVHVSYYFTSIIYQPIKLGAKLDKGGNFALGFEVPDGYTQIEISNGQESTEVFVQPGTDLSMTVDAKHFDSTIHYEGKGKELANFMARHVLERQSMLQFNMKGMMLCSKEPGEFEQAFDELEKSEIDYMNEHGKDLPASFKEYYKVYYRYSKWDIMEIYPHQHEMFKQKTNMVKDIPKEDYIVIDHIPEAYNDDYLDNPAYAGYLVNLIYLKVMAANASDKEKSKLPSGDTCLAIAYKLMPPKTAEYYVGQQIAHSIGHSSEEKLEQKYEVYKAHFPNSKNLALLRQAMSIKKTIGVGKPAPDFEITTPDGTKMKLSDLRGKVVYLDFWSSGCVPCIGEMPDAKKLHEYFKDKPVAFVNVSLDSKDDVWKYAIKKFDVDGINTLEQKGDESEIAKKYGVTGIPHYFLIDKNGKFAVIEGLNRPSDGEKLREQIEKILN